MNAKHLFFVDALQRGPRPAVDFEPSELEHAVADGIVKRLAPIGTGAEMVGLTGSGLEQALSLRQSSGHPLFGMDITDAGLRLSRDLTLEEWQTLILRLKRVNQIYHSAMADCLNYGRDRFGEEVVNDSLEQLQFPWMDIEKANAIAVISLDTRERFPLTSEHYFIIGKLLPDHPAERETWLKNAITHKLSPLALKRSIEAGQIISDTSLTTHTGKNSGIFVLDGLFTVQFKGWLSRRGGIHGLIEEPPAVRARFLQEVQRILEAAEQIKQSLANAAAA